VRVFAKEEMKQIVIAGFPGIGKSHLFNNPGGLVVFDSDSSHFGWMDAEKKARDPRWPDHYIQYVQDILPSADIVLVSTHKPVREMLRRDRMPFWLVYPGMAMKEEYIQRYRDRGNAESFVALLEKNYESWIRELNSQLGCRHKVLTGRQYLSYVLTDILSAEEKAGGICETV
jgi:hypothetical protein